MNELTPDQEQFIRDNYAKMSDLNELTRNCYNDPSLDGRTKEGRLVRKFLIDNKFQYSTTKKIKSDEIGLSSAQKEFILLQTQSGVSSFRIAEMVFSDREVKKLGLEQRTVLDYIRSVNPDFVIGSENASLTEYSPPKAFGRILKKINDATGLKLEEDKVSRQYRMCVDKLGINLANSRFVAIINNYISHKDRYLFEEEFVRLTWDKPDLSADELNLYMNVCKEIINLEVIGKHLNKLNDQFDDIDDQQDMTVRLAEIIKAKSGEYHQCEGRIENLTKKLQGDRAERMKSKFKDNASIISLVQLFQDEEERKNMVNIAEMQKQIVSDEANRLESMGEWKARVLGVAKEDVI
jgi:hypothetical protein